MGSFFSIKRTCNNCELNKPLLDKKSCESCYHMEHDIENFQSLLVKEEEQKKSLFACILKIPRFYINRNYV